MQKDKSKGESDKWKLRRKNLFNKQTLNKNYGGKKMRNKK